jgi:hypothetical protein
MIEVPEFLEELVAAGIDITISRSIKHGVYFDLNLRAKSHMFLFKRETGQWFVAMRYDEEFPVNDIEDLKSLAVHGMHGRDLINYNWERFLESDNARTERKLREQALSKLTAEERQALKLS